jgi:radical SAM superfamily enzyme YgiQ (UPF0313 family)
VEQGTEEGLLRFRKGVTLPEVEGAFRACRRAGIQTVAYFILGSPVERTREDVLRTIRYSLDLQADFAMFNVLTPFPGTVLYDEGVRDGVIDPEPWRRFLLDPREDFVAPLWEEHLGSDQLRDLLALAWRRFYGRPSYILRQVLRVRSRRDLERKARAGLRVLTGR